MSLQLTVHKYSLDFKFAARTSRGAMQQHQVYFLKLREDAVPEKVGIGECAPLPGLSPEHGPHYETGLQDFVMRFNRLKLALTDLDLAQLVTRFELTARPSIRFGLETAILDWQNQGKKLLFNNYFSRSEGGIPINGLIWMGDQAYMEQQIEEKLREGYSCLKLKIGGLDFKTELEILRHIRSMANADILTIRLDANGAFAPAEAMQKLEQLAIYDIHSIEQPIKPKQLPDMARLCAHSPIPIALDEELIGVVNRQDKMNLLADLTPAFIILKPTLVGGFTATRDWIEQAQAQQINWWITSALESNIGLNAISQFTAELAPQIEQGLGTGQLYHNNIVSPLQIEKGMLFYSRDRMWGSVS